jgi:hypothetical protein
MRSKRKLIGKGRASSKAISKGRASKASKASSRASKASSKGRAISNTRQKVIPIVPMGTVFIVNTTNGSVRKIENGKSFSIGEDNYGYKVVKINSDGSMYLIKSVTEHHTTSNGTPTTSRHIQDMFNKSKIN